MKRATSAFHWILCNKAVVCYRFNLWQTAVFPYFTEFFPSDILKKNDLNLGIQTKPVVIGPFTFLKLVCCTSKKTSAYFADDILLAYTDILKRCGKNGVEWLQVDRKRRLKQPFG